MGQKIPYITTLANWPKNALINFALKNCLFRVTNIVKNNDKERYVYRGYRIASDGKISWSLNDDFARDVIILRVENSSSSHTENPTSNCSILGQGDTFGINGRFGAPETKN